MQTRVIQNTTKKQYPKPHELRNTKTKFCSEKFIVSNLTFPSLFLNEKVINQFLPSLYYGLKKKYKNIENIKVSANPKSILLNIENFLKKETYNNFYKLEFDVEDEMITVYNELDYDSFNLWFIAFENILPLKYKTPKLFKIIMAYLSKFNIADDSAYIDSGLSMAKDEVSENETYYKKDYLQSVRSEVKYYNKISKEFETDYDLDTLLNSYRPRKRKYKEILSLIKKSNLDFNLLNSLAIPQTDFEDMENALYFRELFGFIYDTGIVYEEYILPTINSIFQEYDVIPPLDTMIIKKGKIIKDFSYKNNELKNITNFIIDFNELINNI